MNDLIQTAIRRKQSLAEILTEVQDGISIRLNRFQRTCILDLWDFLEKLRNRIAEPNIKAGELLDWMVATLDYLDYFQDYYGEGEHSDDKCHAVMNFIRYIVVLGDATR